MSTKRDTFLALLKKKKTGKAVIDAFSAVKQEDFFDAAFRKSFYTDETIPIGTGERSDPLTSLARMFGILAPQKKWRVLEVGTGSGYSTAVLSRLVREVVTVDLYGELSAAAKARCKRRKYDNIRFYSGDGTDHEPSLGIFDAVIVCGACRKRPLSLMRSLRRGGRMVFPMGLPHQQQITLVINDAPEDGDGLLKVTFHDLCVFSLLQGRYGFPVYLPEYLEGNEPPVVELME
ncbi:MAG: protein-L-isoaspartate O-methyltransferase [Spirochaetes bacterium]|jgi:protein-L-isoaspartate(D-aspartate) O-methyltransferase|nr:protein-L-isoaspartate O-methyltransferase [Spirochaetota bacterium]